VELFEYETEETIEREEAARRLRELADQLERHNEVKVSLDGLPVTVKVPKQVTYELEVEVEDGESEIEITISW
jgi:amphi-Trp domain-containing protein